MADTTKSASVPGLPFYSFEVYKDDGKGKPTLASSADFGNKDTKVLLRIPPSNLRISVPIRAQVDLDLLGGITAAQGGLGLRRWTISGTHGAGTSPKLIRQAADGTPTMSSGYMARNAINTLFETWATQNEKLRRENKPTLRLLFAVRGGSLSEFQNEEWWIQPDSLPEDSRSAGRPHAWDWSLSFMALMRMTEQDLNFTTDSLIPPSLQDVINKNDEAIAKLNKAIAKAQTAQKKGLLDNLRSIRDKLMKVRDGLKNIKGSVSSAVSTYRGIVSGVSGFVRSCATTVQETMLMLDRSNLFDQPSRDLFNALRECQTALGNAKMVVDGYLNPYTPSQVTPVSAPVQPGDTLQSLAVLQFGDASRWKELADLNNLAYPYFDFSGPNGTPSIESINAATIIGKRVLGQGDTLKLPNSVGEVSPDDPIGTDMADAGKPHILVAGVDNLRAALLRRLRTPKGWLPHHPDYGSALPAFVGEPLTPALVVALRAEVDRVLREDPRVLSVQQVGVSVDFDAIYIEASATSCLGPVSLSGTVGGLVNNLSTLS